MYGLALTIHSLSMYTFTMVYLCIENPSLQGNNSQLDTFNTYTYRYYIRSFEIGKTDIQKQNKIYKIY